MEVTRRDFVALAAIAAGSGLMPRETFAQAISPERLLEFQSLGNVTLLHMTDSHAALLPVYYREPDTLLPVGDETGKPPYITGEAALKYYGFAKGSLDAHAFTHVDFAELARRYGKMGGYAHIASLVKRVRAERPGKVLFMDGGDTLQGSATSTWTQGRDMVDVINHIGVEMLSPHWEFTFGIDKMKEYFGDLEKGGLFKGEFLAHNVMDVTWKDPIFKPYAVRQVGGVAVGVIGQAFPYTPISHPRKYVPDLTFGIQEAQVQKYADELRNEKKVDLVVLLSHNGFDVDMKLASRVKGLDVVFGGHTHEVIPRTLQVGKTLVIRSGAHGKYLARLDLDVREGRIQAHRFKMIPVLSSHIPADEETAALIAKIRAPYESKLKEVLAVSESVLYRRGNFNGTFDEVILDALIKRYDAEVAFSPGFRWGVTLLPGQPITYEDAFTHMALNYPNTWTREMTGEEIKTIMEDVADNLFNADPYYRQGGDMVRVGGVSYTIDPEKTIGNRITDLTVGGKPMDPKKKYKAAGWASVNDVDGPPVHDVVADYLRSVKRVKIERSSRVRIV